ncbi:ABC transporter permease [Limnovirga soli]|uniref:FtsX-like permease family protein n=1 Tax=Limnovirga soli TaxID=2656915 RepID=A0A8J8FFP1_9BACT|nr:ABC transporter permease [Limnovirga soli]NNV55499.1 FtsX-like permease family protein [Limnovirga soli]
MIRHYFKTTIQYFRHHKMFAFINIMGFAVGLCICFFALLYIQFENSYDTQNIQADNIYRLVTDVQSDKGIAYESSAGPMGPAIAQSFPEVKSVTRIFLDNLIIQNSNSNFAEETIAYADASLFDVFTIPLLEGNLHSALDAPYCLVLSTTAAKKYFGSEEALGKTLLLDGKFPARVTGIMKDMPLNAQFRVDIFVSMPTLLSEWNQNLAQNWNRFGFYTYLLLPENYDAAKLSAKLPAFIQSHITDNTRKYTLSLEPLKWVYLNGKPRGSRTGTAVTGNANNIYIFSLVSLFILIISSFNFINLSTAHSLKRARETALRKVIGASKQQLVLQFFSEAFFLSGIAYLLAIVMCILLLPLFNQVMGKVISSGIFNNIAQLGWMLLIALVNALLAAVYPAILQAKIRIAENLKGHGSHSLKNITLRKTLVISQLSIAIILVVATLVVNNQLNYMRNIDLGFTKDHFLTIDFHFDSLVINREATVRQELLSIPGIKTASIGSTIPGKTSRKLTASIENNLGTMLAADWDMYAIDNYYIQQYQIPIIAGRNFSAYTGSDTTEAMLINEAAAKTLGYIHPSDALGKKFTQKGSNGTIIGVVKDFHFQSFQQPIQPLVFKLAPWFHTFISLSVTSADMQGTIAQIENKWKQLVPGLPLIYDFSDDAYNTLYKSEDKFHTLFIILSSVAIFLSCLGLYGLSAFTTIQRKKEIGIRKIIGATVANMVYTLGKDFLWLILIAILIASPLAWLLMHQWLQHNYAYRITINASIFLQSAAIILIITIGTIAFHIIHAASANPVNNLKTE